MNLSSRHCHFCGHPEFLHHHGVCADPVDCLCKRPLLVMGDDDAADHPSPRLAAAVLFGLPLVPLALVLLAVWTGDPRFGWSAAAMFAAIVGLLVLALLATLWGEER